MSLTLSEQTRKALNVGLRNHIHCALDHEVEKDFFTLEQVPAAIRPEYVELISAVNKQVGKYTEVAAHKCTLNERKFIHLILKRGEIILSLVMTKDESEGFKNAAQVASFDDSGAPLYRGRLQSFEVVGFEVPSHLAFVVSNLPERENLQFASSVAPSIRNFLAKIEAVA